MFAAITIREKEGGILKASGHESLLTPYFTGDIVHAMMKRIIAWTVHAYTALGLVAGVFSLKALFSGDMRASFLWLAASLAIDSTDGFFARRFRCAEILPGFRGRALDDIVDYFTFVVVPAVILVHAKMLPYGNWYWALIPLLSSAYGFSRKEAKTPDGFFTGFPSYWNIVVFYFYYLALPPGVRLAIVSAFAFLVFIPLKYIDPFKTKPLRPLTVPLTLLWGASVVWTLILMPKPSPRFVRLMLLYPYYYFIASLCLNIRMAVRDRRSG